MQGYAQYRWVRKISEWLDWLLFFQISYTGVGKTQLNFLRLLSEKATQTFDMTCKGSKGCFDSKSNALEKAIRLQGANDGVLSYMKSDPNVKITQVWTFHHVKESSQNDIFSSKISETCWTVQKSEINEINRSVSRSLIPSVRASVWSYWVSQLIGRSVGQTVTHSVSLNQPTY